MNLLTFTLKTIISMYLAFNCHITIGNVVIDNISSLEIRSGVRTLTKTAKLTIPRNLQYKGKRIDEAIKKRDQVVIELGYNGELNEEFRGYVLEVKPGEPLVILMEDEMMQLKEKSYTKKWKDASLSDVIGFIAPDYAANAQVADLKLGSFQVKEATAAFTFDAIAKQYNIFTRFVTQSVNGVLTPVLHSGLAYGFDFDRHIYHFQKNVKSGNNLAFKYEDDIRIRIKAISNQKDGKKLVAYAGENYDGEQTRNFGPGISQAQLQEYANAALEEIRHTGYFGSIKGFGHPYVQPGDTVDIRDNRYLERAQFSANLVDDVTVRVGQWYFERICKLGKSV